MQPTTSKNLTSFKNIAISFIMMATAAFLIYFSFKNVSLLEILVQIKEANLFWISCSFIASLVALFYRAQRWRDLVVATGYKSNFLESLHGLSVGYLTNLAFPRLGELTRCGYLKKYAGVPVNVGIGTVVIERVVDVMSLLACFIIITIVEVEMIGGYMMSNFVDPVYLKIKVLKYSTILFFVFAILVCIIFLMFILRKNYFKNKNAPAIIKGFYQGLKSIIVVKSKARFAFQSIMIWFFYFLSVYACLFALPSTADLGYKEAFFLLVIGGIAMSAPVQGGIGIYHLLVSQGLVIYGISPKDGLAFATLIHSLQLILILLFGVLALFRTINTSSKL